MELHFRSIEKEAVLTWSVQTPVAPQATETAITDVTAEPTSNENAKAVVVQAPLVEISVAPKVTTQEQAVTSAPVEATRAAEVSDDQTFVPEISETATLDEVPA